MAIVSDQTIAHAALAGGFPRDKAAMAVAVALAESDGNATATNKNTNGTTDYGLWQINSIHKADLASGDWRDPAANARMAYAVYRRAGNSFSPWYAWRNGRHLAKMSRAQLAVINADASGLEFPIPPIPVPDLPTPDVPNPVAGAAEVLKFGAKALSVITDKDFWIRAGMFLAGSLIMIAAVVGLFVAIGGKGRVKKIGGQVKKEMNGGNGDE